MNAISKKLFLITTSLLLFSSTGYCIRANKYYAALTATVSPTGSGTVYVNGDDNVSARDTCTNVKYANSAGYYWLSEYIKNTVNFEATATPNSGYSFTRWIRNGSEVSTSATYSASYEVSQTKSTDAETNAETYTITALFSPIDYTISFSANGGTGTNPSNIPYNIESTGKTFPACPYTKTGYTFDGWKPHSNVGNWSTSELFEALTSVPTGKWGTVTLDAQWKEIEYADISITVSGLDNNDSAMFTVSSGGSVLYTVSLSGSNPSVTIKDLPTGVNYTVKASSSWSWAYGDPDPTGYTFGLGASGYSASFEYIKKDPVKKHDEKTNVNWKPSH